MSTLDPPPLFYKYLRVPTGTWKKLMLVKQSLRVINEKHYTNPEVLDELLKQWDYSQK